LIQTLSRLADGELIIVNSVANLLGPLSGTGFKQQQQQLLIHGGVLLCGQYISRHPKQNVVLFEYVLTQQGDKSLCGIGELRGIERFPIRGFSHTSHRLASHIMPVQHHSDRTALSRDPAFLEKWKKQILFFRVMTLVSKLRENSGTHEGNSVGTA